MEKEKKSMELFMFDADQLIDKIIPTSDNESCDYEFTTGTSRFILDFYEKLEEYRLVRGIDDIVVSFMTKRGRCFLRVYGQLLDYLNNNPNIKLGSGFYTDPGRYNAYVSASPIKYNEYTSSIHDEMYIYVLNMLSHNMKNMIVTFANEEYQIKKVFWPQPGDQLKHANIDGKTSFEKKNIYKIGLRDVTTQKSDEGVLFNRNIVLEEMTRLIEHAKAGNQDFSNISGKYSFCFLDNEDAIYFEDGHEIEQPGYIPKQIVKTPKN